MILKNLVSHLKTEEIVTSVQFLILFLGDIIFAFDALDNTSKLPVIFVEATDLRSIPPVVLDPTAKKLSENTSSIDCLTSVISQLSENFSLPPADTRLLKTTLSTTFRPNLSPSLSALKPSLPYLQSVHCQALRFPLLDIFMVFLAEGWGWPGSEAIESILSINNHSIYLPEASLMETISQWWDIRVPYW